MSTTRFKTTAGAGAFALAAALGLSAAAVVPAQSAVVAAAPTATTTTVAVQSPTVAYGDTGKVTVSVDTTSAGGPKPEGNVELTVADKTYVAALAKSGKVDFDLPLLGASKTPYALTATFVPAAAAAFSTSTSAPVNVTITKDETTSKVTARHNKSKRRIVAKNTVTSDHGQVPTGKAKFVLRRNGVKIAKTVVSLNDAGMAKAKFRKVRNRGDYKVVSKFLGSRNFAPSKGSFKIPR